MLEQILKWQIDIKQHGLNELIPLPISKEAVILPTLFMQNGKISFWAKVPEDKIDKINKCGKLLKVDRSYRNFIIIGTGQSYTSKSTNYIGTIQDGDFIWHLLEVLK